MKAHCGHVSLGRWIFGGIAEASTQARHKSVTIATDLVAQRANGHALLDTDRRVASLRGLIETDPDMQASARPALFLDRDGVINVDRGFVARREDFEWLPGIFDAARTARRLGYALVVVTNQSGIGRGYYSEGDFADLTDYMRERFAQEKAPLDAVYHCAFHPDALEERYRHPDHPWRKPRPGMILAARDEHGIDLARSAMVGDRLSDAEAGVAAGVGAVALIGPGEPLAGSLARVERLARVLDLDTWLRRAAARWS